MTSIIALITGLGLAGGGVIVVLIYFALNPEKVEKWAALVARAMSGLGGAFRSLKKNYIKLDFQGRVNEFVKQLRASTPSLETDRVYIEWVDDNSSRKTFIDNGRAVIRLRASDTQDDNFVHAAFSFVSTALLFRAKRHLSLTQKESLDLFVAGELIRKEKPAAVVDRFLDLYLHPLLTDKKRKSYHVKFSRINEHGLLFPVFIQELDFVGRKVFASGSRSELVKDFDGLIEFLHRTACRVVGDQSDLEFRGDHSRIAIMIIGKPSKLWDADAYVHFLGRLADGKRIDGVYAVGLKENRRNIDEIVKSVSNWYSIWQTGLSESCLNYKNGQRRIVEQYFVVLRRKAQELVYQ